MVNDIAISNVTALLKYFALTVGGENLKQSYDVPFTSDQVSLFSLSGISILIFSRIEPYSQSVIKMPKGLPLYVFDSIIVLPTLLIILLKIASSVSVGIALPTVTTLLKSSVISSLSPTTSFIAELSI